MNKLTFLQQELPNLLLSIAPETHPVFGKMNAHQMIEHLSFAFQQASGQFDHPLLNDEETTAKLYKFMMSDKPFRDNTPNPILPDEPPAPKTENIEEAVHNLRKDISIFIQTFEGKEGMTKLNPFFGNLNFEEWMHLLNKHMQHHLRQFNVVV